MSSSRSPSPSPACRASVRSSTPGGIVRGKRRKEECEGGRGELCVRGRAVWDLDELLAIGNAGALLDLELRHEPGLESLLIRHLPRTSRRTSSQPHATHSCAHIAPLRLHARAAHAPPAGMPTGTHRCNLAHMGARIEHQSGGVPRNCQASCSGPRA